MGGLDEPASMPTRLARLVHAHELWCVSRPAAMQYNPSRMERRNASGQQQQPLINAALAKRVKHLGHV